MKRYLHALSALLCLALLFSGCGAPAAPEATDPPAEQTEAQAPATQEITAEPTTAEETTEAAPEKAPVSLKGKKAIFLGNSMVYYGGIVTQGAQRFKDTGLFYRICKENGEELTVTDCTYGNHKLSDFTEKGCTTSGCDVGIGGDLLKGLDLNSYDYVFMSEAGQNNGSIVRDVRNIMKRFTNPSTVFIYLCHTYSYTNNHTSITANLPTLKKFGVEIVDWGHLCYDVYKGNVKVEGATQTYEKNTFVNKTSSDSHHPNPLAGYVASMMCYCALTGKSAVGMDYSYVKKLKYGSGSTAYSGYKAKYYTAGTSNFDAVFDSPADMEGIQKLIDSYLNRWELGVGYEAPETAEPCEHTFDAGKVTVEATAQVPGVRVFTCTKCGYTNEESIPQLEASRTNIAKGADALLYSPSKTSIGKGATLTDGNIGDNANGRVDGAFTGSGPADAFGGKGISDSTGVMEFSLSGGKTLECYYALRVDLGAVHTADGITVYAQGYKRPVLDTGVVLLISKDGETWKPVYEAGKAELFSGVSDGKGWENYVDDDSSPASELPPAYLSVNFAAEEIRYAAYCCTGVRGINGYYTTRFTEFEIYGK